MSQPSYWNLPPQPGLQPGPQPQMNPPQWSHFQQPDQNARWSQHAQWNPPHGSQGGHWNPGLWGVSQPFDPGAWYGRPRLVPEPPREIVIAYALLLLLGTFGLHKFYLGNHGMGGFYLALGIFGWLTSWLLIGFLLLIPLWLMLFLDLFTLPDQVRRANTRY